MGETLTVPATISQAEADVLGVPVYFYVQLVRKAASLVRSETFTFSTTTEVFPVRCNRIPCEQAACPLPAGERKK